jgi:hypothetical protein
MTLTELLLSHPLSRTASLAGEYKQAAMQASQQYAAIPGQLFFNPETSKIAHWVSKEARLHEPWIMIKRSMYHPLKQPLKTFSDLQSYVGGPSPLAAMLVGGGIGGGLGYGAGWLASQFMPEEYFDKRRVRNVAALAGAALGSFPGLYTGTLQYRPVAPGAKETYGDYGLSWTDYGPLRSKQANRQPNEAGSLFSKTIPVDAFNKAVWQNVVANPYGTKDAFGDNSQSLSTPPGVAAVATGVVGLASTLNDDSRKVSPFEIGLAVAKSGLGGLAGGWALGKTMGALAGLSDGAQTIFQRTGLWGGMLTGAVSKLME